MAQSKNMVQEMVVSLSAEIDNPGIQKIMTLLDTNKFKVMTLGAAITAATTGIYKFISSITKEEIELRQLAKTKNKQIEQLRAEEDALKTMGKTLNDIKKDKALKSMYDDLVKFNKEMALPNMDRAMEKINNLRGAFYKFRSAISYSLKWIGAQVLTNLEAPIDRVTGKLTKAANWIRDNIHQITSKIASFITAFAKGLIGIAETVEKIVNKVNGLPDGIKAIGSAIAIVAGILSSGPFGKVLAAITMIGDIIHDYENYQWNKKNLENPEVYKADNEKGYTSDINDPNLVMENGKPVAYQVPIAFGGFYDIYTDESADTKTKSRNIAEKLVEKITEIFRDITDILAENHSLSDALSKDTSLLGQIFSGVQEFFDNNPEKVGEMFTSMFDALAETLSATGGWGASVIGAIAKVLTLAFSDGDESVWNNSELKEALNGDNGIVNGLVGALELSAIGASPIVSIIGGVIGGWTTARDKALRELYESKTGKSAEGLKKSFLEDWLTESGFEGELNSSTLGTLQDDFNTTINAVIKALTGGIKIVGDVAGNLLKTIIFAIIGNSKSDASNTITAALNSIGEDNPIWDGLATGLATWIASGNFLVGLFSGIGTTLASAENEEQLRKAAEEFLEMFNTIWEGAWINEADHSKGRNGKGLHSFIKSLWEGSDGENGLKRLFTGLGEKIVEWLEPVGNAIINWISGLLDNIWIAIYNGMPDWVKTGIEIMTGRALLNPNKSEIKKDENGEYIVDSEGNYILKSTNNKELKITPEQFKMIMDNNLLDMIYTDGNGIFGNSKFGYGADGVFDENGNFTPSVQGYIDYLAQKKAYEDWEKEYQDTLYYNEHLNDWRKTGGDAPKTTPYKSPKRKSDAEILELEKNALALYDELWNDEFEEDGILNRVFDPEDRARVMDAIGEYVSAGGNARRFTFNQDGTISYNEDEPVIANYEIEGAEEAASQANAEAQAYLDSHHVKGNVDYDADTPDDPPKAWGGRIGSAGRFIVGEDGAEYIIPVTKPNRAVELIMQMLGEMGSSVTERIFSGMGLGQTGTIGASMASLNSAMSGMVMNNTYNISAPVNINVNASGVSAEDVGTQAYNLAERHLLKSLRGVYA